MLDLLILAVVVQWLVLFVMGIALILLMRNFGTLHTALASLRTGESTTLKLTIGQLPPALPLTDLAQHPVAPLVDGRHPITLAIVSPGCGPCQQLVQDLTADPAQQRHTVVLSVGTPEETQTLFTDFPHLPVPVVFAPYDVVKREWGVSATPTTVLLTADGQVADYRVGYTSLASSQPASRS